MAAGLARPLAHAGPDVGTDVGPDIGQNVGADYQTRDVEAVAALGTERLQLRPNFCKRVHECEDTGQLCMYTRCKRTGSKNK